MSDLIIPNNSKLLPEDMEKLLITGDLAKLSPEQRVLYYNSVCESLGLNPLTKPFAYITLNGKLTLYALKDATEQLRKINKVSLTITSREKIGDVYIVTARAKLPDGREDESTGAVCIANLKGEQVANAYMKAETKSKRRVTLSICGLGMLDDTEIESIPGAIKDIPKEETREDFKKTQLLKPINTQIVNDMFYKETVPDVTIADKDRLLQIAQDKSKPNQWTNSQLIAYLKTAFRKNDFFDLTRDEYNSFMKAVIEEFPVEAIDRLLNKKGKEQSLFEKFKETDCR